MRSLLWVARVGRSVCAVPRPIGTAGFSSLVPQSEPRVLECCVVGSGPAGFYTVDRLLKRLGDSVHVDLLDRLPTPFGLVRSGVAPDHQPTKNVVNQFSSVAADRRVSFYGNVALGKDVTVAELRALYHVVVLAYGAESDRTLGIPGEGGVGVFSARQFVWWYNGHPDMAHLPVDLAAVRSVAVCGIGNVALDCARVLLQPPQRLQPTDIAAHALHALTAARAGIASPAAGSTMASDAPARGVAQPPEAWAGVQDVHLVARRGPAQAACTPKELKELVTDLGVTVCAQPQQLEVSDADRTEMAATRTKRRVYDIIKAAVQAGQPPRANSTAPAPAPGSASAAATAAAPTPGAPAPAQPAQGGALHGDPHAGAPPALGGCEGGVQGAGHRPHAPQRRLHFQFYRRPHEILLDAQGRVKGLRVEVTQLVTPAANMPPAAVGTGRFEDIDAQMVLVSIGYKSLPTAGVAFDARQGTIPHRQGRVLDIGSTAEPSSSSSSAESAGDVRTMCDAGGPAVVPGLYVCGWLKRGPSGIIGTNAADAEDTVASILEDRAAGKLAEPSGVPWTAPSSTQVTELAAVLQQRGVQYITWPGWQRIDALEVEAGKLQHRVREKMVDLAHMLKSAAV